MAEPGETMSPPKPVFALAVGIIGHKPNRLPEEARPAVSDALAHVLGAIKAAADEARTQFAGCFAEGVGCMTLVSAVAEGADSAAANTALLEGYVLDVLLPFGRDEYEKDFEDANRPAFRALLERARVVLELSETRSDAGKSYEASGIAILDASDILVTVWDGGDSAGRGGTTELVAEAGRRGMPIVHIDANARAPTRILWQGLEAKQKIYHHIMDHPSAPFDEQIGFVVDTLIRPPASGDELEGLKRFYSERHRDLILREGFPLLMAAFFVRAPQWTDFRPVSPKSLTDSVANTVAENAQVLAVAYGWADTVGVYFSQMFRSTYINNFVFSALAVLSAVLPLIFKPGWIFAIAELGLIVWILFNTQMGLKQHLHQRWVESREVAERVRVALPMTILGTRPLGPYGEALTWTNWYTRALLRGAGISGGTLTSERLGLAHVALESLLKAQLDYQLESEMRFAKLDRRMRRAGDFLLIITLVAVACHLVFQMADLANRELIDNGLIAISTALPAMGAAFFGIRMIGDFEGTAKRAGRMYGELTGLSRMLATLPDDFHSLRAFSLLTAEVILGDVASWRLAAESRGLSVPG